MYKKFKSSGYTKGEWLTINKDIKMETDINWDITDKSVVRVLNFKSWRKVFFGGDLFQNFEDKEGIIFKFKNNCILDVYNQNMENVYHIVNPNLIIFSNEFDPRIYRINPKDKYIFFARTSDEDQNFSSEIYRVKDMQKVNIKGRKCSNNQMCYVDEDNLFNSFYKRCEDIRDAMYKRGYDLVSVEKSEEYLSFPNNTISNKVELETELGDVLILVTTNKSITTEMKNHGIEINSGNNSFVWKPEGDDTIVHMLLDNCDQDDVFKFYERTTNIKNSSNILPFQVLVFKGS
tara:strand:- start:1894 stop:2763 length:870 start_codon:yes stop_codon:yes gene_type:complete